MTVLQIAQKGKFSFINCINFYSKKRFICGRLKRFYRREYPYIEQRKGLGHLPGSIAHMRCPKAHTRRASTHAKHGAHILLFLLTLCELLLAAVCAQLQRVCRL